MKKLFVILLLAMFSVPLSLLSISSALLDDVAFSPVEDPPKIGQAEFNYLATGIINVDGLVNNLEMKIRAIPQVCDTPSITYGEIKSDEMGTYLEQTYSSRTADVNWNVICSFEHSSELLQLTNLSRFPFSGDYPASVETYLEFTPLVNTNDEVALTASQIASGSRTNLEAAMRVARWLNKEVEYDLLYNATIEDSCTVFSDMRGTCDEFTALFMSMMRNLNIPARYVSGYAYGNIYGAQFNSHAWAEVYIDGQWIPMDPTYGEYGYVDALHFPLYYAIDGNQSTITTRWFPPGTVTITRPAISHSINVISSSGFDEFLELETTFSDEDVAVGDYILVTTNITNPTPYYIPISIMLSMTNSTQVVYGYQRDFALLEPYASKLRYYVLEVLSCSANYPYQCVNPTEVFVTGVGGTTHEVYVKPWLSPTTNLDSILTQIQIERMEMLSVLDVIDFSIDSVFYTEPEIFLKLKNIGNSILSNLRAEIEYSDVRRVLHFGDLLINRQAEDSVVMPLPGDHGIYNLTINFTAQNFSHMISSNVIYAPMPTLNISFSGDAVFSGFQETEFDLEFSGTCGNRSLTILTPTASYSVAPVLDSYHVKLTHDYFLPGENNITLSVDCYDAFGTNFNFQDHVILERQVIGLDLVTYYIFSIGRFLATVFDTIAGAITRFIYPPLE